MTEHFQLPSDIALEEQTRTGSEAAWNELSDRHRDAIDALARSRANRGVQHSVDSVFEELRAGIVAPQQRPDGQPQPPIRPRAVALADRWCVWAGMERPDTTGIRHDAAGRPTIDRPVRPRRTRRAGRGLRSAADAVAGGAVAPLGRTRPGRGADGDSRTSGRRRRRTGTDRAPWSRRRIRRGDIGCRSWP